MKESTIERHLRVVVKSKGARAFKIISPGLVGMPDRMILIPGGRVVFVELKRPGEVPSPIQQKRIKELQALGFEAYVVDSTVAVNDLVKQIFGGG